MNGTIINPSGKIYLWKMLKAEILLRSFNRTAVWNLPKRNWILKRLLGRIEGKPYLIQIPFHISLGCNTYIGENFFANYNCTIMDYAPVNIGNNVFIAPNVTITTVNHSLIPKERRVFSYKDSFHPKKLEITKL